MRRAGIVTAIALLALPSFAFARQDEERVSAIAARIELGLEGLEADLVSMGPTAIAPLIDVLAGGPLSPSKAELTTEERDAVLAALAAMPPASLREQFEAVAVAAERDARRVEVALAILCRMGTANDVPLCAQLVTPLDGADAVPRALRVAFEETLSAVAMRDDGTAWVLRGTFGTLHRSLLAPAVRCIAAEPPVRSLAILAGLLGRAPGIDGYVLNEVARAAAHAPRPIDGHVLASVRSTLDARDPSEQILAVRAVGELDDFDAFPRLIRMLGEDDERLRAAADKALERMSGRVFRGNARAWDAWYADETAWWRGARASLLRIDNRDPSVALEALHDVSGHRLYRHELAQGVAVALERPERELVLIACSILKSLESRAALPALVRGLDRPERELSDAILKTLQAVAGVAYPRDDPAWRELAKRELSSSGG